MDSSNGTCVQTLMRLDFRVELGSPGGGRKLDPRHIRYQRKIDSTRYPKFGATESEDPLDWMDEMVRLRCQGLLPDLIVRDKLALVLLGPAADWYKRRSSAQPHLKTWKDWKEAFLKEFEQNSTWGFCRAQALSQMYYDGNGHLVEWIKRFVKLHQRVHNSTEHQAVLAVSQHVSQEYRRAIELITMTLEKWTVRDFINACKLSDWRGEKRSKRHRCTHACPSSL